MNNLSNYKKDKNFKKWLKKQDYFYKFSFITKLINLTIKKEKFNNYFFEYYIYQISENISIKENFSDLITKEILDLDINNRALFIINVFNFYNKNFTYKKEFEIFLDAYFDYKNSNQFTIDNEYKLLNFYLNLKDSLLKARVRNFNAFLILINKSFYDSKLLKFV